MRRSGATIRHGAVVLLVFGGALGVAWSFVTLLSGGFAFHAGAAVLSSRDPVRPLIVALVLLTTGRLLLSGTEFARLLRPWTGGRDGVAARIACAAAAGVLVFSIAWNTRAAGGSDSSCYVLQADAFARGQVTLTDPLSTTLPGASSAMFAPTGFVPSQLTAFAAVPICGPGLSLVMAAASVAGSGAVFVVVPACAALAVWLTFLLGRRVDDPVTGAAAAVLLAASPIFLYQAVQPMSDVPAATLWLAALVLLSGPAPVSSSGPADTRAPAGRDGARQIAAGICASLAVLLRPNIALIVLPLLALLPDRRGWIRFGLAAAPALAMLAWLNAARYGSPLASGYGSSDALFAYAHVGPNLARYPRWLFETETPIIAAAVLAPWWVRRHRERSSVARLVLVSLSASVLTLATYLAYSVFDDWWYTRFLLPALPVLLVLSVAVSLTWARGTPRVRAGAAVAICALLGAWYLQVARTHHVLDLQALESRFVLAGRYAARALPRGAVALAVQQSGSIRHHGGRSTIAWDVIPPQSLDRTIDALRDAGRPPFIVLESAEEAPFRARFATQQFGRLDWPPTAEVQAPVTVRFYDPAARQPYMRGVARAVELVRR